MIIRYFYIILLSFFLVPSFSFSYDSNQNDLQKLSEENILIVELFINKYPTNEIIEVYQHDGGEFVPLGLVSDILDLAIDVSTENGEARGWVIKEDRLFYLNKHNGEAIINGKSIKIDPQMVIIGLDDIYIDSTLLSTLLPINFKLDFSNLALVAKPREKLPMQIKIERENIHQRLNNRSQQISKTYQVIQDPYRPYEIPIVDIDLGYNYSNNANSSQSVSYSALSQSDLGYLTSNFFISGESETALRNVRLNLNKKSAQNDLLGELKASSFAMGDIVTPSVALVDNQNTGRGFSVSNQDLQRASQFDSTDFIGDSIPGWEVEIYRNGSLLDFLVVDSNGRYEFKDVPIFYDNNTFRLVFYGPQGQVREEFETILIDQAILQKGEFNYSASIDEKLLSVFGVNEDSLSDAQNTGLRTTAKAEYGITDRMTGSLSFISTPLDDGQTHSYYSFGVRNSFARAITNLNLIYDAKDGGTAAQFEAATKINDISFRIEQNLFNSFFSGVEDLENNKKTYESKITADGSFDIITNKSMAYSLEFDYEKYENEREISNYKNRLSSSIKSVNFSNNLNYQKTTQNDTVTTSFTGDFSARTRYLNTSFRISTNYNIEPQASLEAISLTTTKRFPENISTTLTTRKGFSGNEETSFNLSLNKKFKNFTFSTVGQADDQNNFSLGFRLSFAMGHEPRNKKPIFISPNSLSGGIISTQAFLDENSKTSTKSGGMNALLEPLEAVMLLITC